MAGISHNVVLPEEYWSKIDELKDGEIVKSRGQALMVALWDVWPELKKTKGVKKV
jgi:hypothetical protein